MSDRHTILALSTPGGRSGVAVIRVSGQKTRFVVETIAGNLGLPRLARLCLLRSPETDEPLDQAIVLFFPAPASFTGEDVAEFHVHGSRAVISAVLDAITGLSPDIRHAEPGEFARRAFENNKMDLAAIEGLADLIDSETEWQRRQAFRQMEGQLGRLAVGWREKLVMSLAYLDAEIDFMDEGDVGEGWNRIASLGIEETATEITAVLATAKTGERLRDGLEVLILGAPNAGKSSLLNAISKRDVAIVTEHAGTTRDLIEVRCDLDGLPVTMIDTAGLRESSEPIEMEGIRRALERAHSADLVLMLTATDSEPEQYLGISTEIIKIATKSDLRRGDPSCDLAVSTLTGEGVGELLAEITRRLKSQIGAETALVAQARQHEALSQALSFLLNGLGSMKSSRSGPSELIAEDVRLAIRALERLIGKVEVDDVLDQIFGRFCIGK